MNLKYPLKLFLSGKLFQELDFAICLCSHSYQQPVGSHINVGLHHVIPWHNVWPFSLPSPVIDFNIAYSSYECEWLNMEEVLEMGTKPEQKDSPSPQLLPAKPLQELQPFFFAPLFAVSLPALFWCSWSLCCTGSPMLPAHLPSCCWLCRVLGLWKWPNFDAGRRYECCASLVEGCWFRRIKR